MSELFDITSFSLDDDNSYDVANYYDDAENKLVTYYDLHDKIIKMFNTFFDTDVFNISNTAPDSEFCQKFFPNLNVSSDIDYKCLIKDDLQYSQLTYPDIMNKWVGNYLSNVEWKDKVYPCINVGSNDVVQLSPLSSDIEYNQCITTKDIEKLNFYNIEKNSFLLSEIKCNCNVFAQFQDELCDDKFIRWDFNYGGGSYELSFPDLYYDDIYYWLESSILDRLGVEDTIFRIYGGYNLPCRFYFINPAYDDMKVILTSSKDKIVHTYEETIPHGESGEILFPFDGEKITLDIMPYDYEIGMKFIKTTGISITAGPISELTVYINEPATFDIPVSIEVYLYAGLSGTEEYHATNTVIIPSGETEGSITFNCNDLIGQSYWKTANAYCEEEKIIENNNYIYIYHHSEMSTY